MQGILQINPLKTVWSVITLPQRIAVEWIKLGVEIAGGVPAGLLPLFSPILLSRREDAAAYPFLSEDWIEAARAIREEYRGKTAAPPVVRINQIVTDVPFGSGELRAHTDTSGGDLEMDLGHIDEADLTVTIGYDVAKALLVDMDVQGAMQAFMQGQIKVEGDITKLMALQMTQVEPLALEAASRIQAITV